MAHAPQRRCAQPVPGPLKVLRGALSGHLTSSTSVMLYHRNDDSVAGTDIVQQEVAERMEDLASECRWNRKRATIDFCSRRRCGQGPHVADRAADLVKQHGPSLCLRCLL